VFSPKSLVPLCRRNGHGRLTSQEGQSLIEFALVAPLILILVLGIIDIGRALGYKNDETNLANIAARIAVVSSGTTCAPCSGASPAITGPDAIRQYVLSQAPAELKNGSTSVATPADVTFLFPNTTSATSKGYCKGDPVKITVTSGYRWLSFLTSATIPFSGGRRVLPVGVQSITATTTMRMETDYNPTASNVFQATDANGHAIDNSYSTC